MLRLTWLWRNWGLNEVQPRRNCDLEICSQKSLFDGLNEVQFPKELRQPGHAQGLAGTEASMKCSSRKNCNMQYGARSAGSSPRLNEVQLPKELRPVYDSTLLGQNEPQ